jgi:hypothetical protein
MAYQDSTGFGSYRGGGSLASKNKPSILDKDKLKNILENLRNDKPLVANENGLLGHSKNFQSKPRYLNTIESEGNLPSHMFNNRQEQLMSQRSIHSLESLKSEGSQEDKRVERYEEEKVDNENLSAQNSFKQFTNLRSQNVPMHTGDNGSDNHEDGGDYGSIVG